jgi:hypothetical protein
LKAILARPGGQFGVFLSWMKQNQTLFAGFGSRWGCKCRGAIQFF